MTAQIPRSQLANMFGWRNRIGLIVPSSDGTCEVEFNRYVPDGVSLHSSRVMLKDGVTDAASLREMNQGIDTSVELLKTTDVDIIAYACTTGSLIEGNGYEAEIEQQISDNAGVPSVATAASVKRAFKALNAKSIAVATPYVEELNRLEKQFLEDSGFEVIDVSGLGLRTDNEIGDQHPETAYQEVRKLNHTAADCIFISCTGYHTADIIEPLEADLEKPVVTSNQATLWDALRKLRVDYSEIPLGTLYSQ